MTANNCGNRVTMTALPLVRFKTPSRKRGRLTSARRGWSEPGFLRYFLCCCCLAAMRRSFDLARLKVPPGFHISGFCEAPNARQMAFSPGGVLLVTDMSDGTVLAFPDPKHTGRAEQMVPVLTD